MTKEEMTNEISVEEAIEVFKFMKRDVLEESKEDKVLDMAIKALEQTELNPSYNSVKTELDHVIDEIIIRIEQTRDKDKLCEYPYNRCIDIAREVLG